MQSARGAPKFTGEFFVPGQAAERIEADHLARYRFAAAYAPGRRVLDIACGVGYSAPMMLDAGALSYTGVDMNEELVRYATDTYGSPTARYCAGDICDFRSEEPFDLITCFETIEHVRKYHAAIGNLYKLLGPGGHLLISSPNRPVTSPAAATLADRPDNEFHTQEFTPDELIGELRCAGFDVAKHGLFGQRRRLALRSDRADRVLRRFFGNPDQASSPEVRRLWGLTPRYFIVIASR